MSRPAISNWGSFLTAAWTHERSGSTAGAGRFPGGALERLWSDSAIDALLLKLSWHVGT